MTWDVGYTDSRLLEAEKVISLAVHSIIPFICLGPVG